jgi:hypothetical protein
VLDLIKPLEGLLFFLTLAGPEIAGIRRAGRPFFLLKTRFL